MGDYALLEPEENGPSRSTSMGRRCVVAIFSLDPPHRLVIGWEYAGSDRLPPGASTVELLVVADGAGTLVELQHRDLPAQETPGHAGGWGHYLGRLQSAAAYRDPGVDPGMSAAYSA